MKIKMPSLYRPKYVLAAMVLTIAALLPSFLTSHVYAAQITSRTIKMSSSAAGATGVSYEVSFKPGSGYTLKGMVVEFCKDSPIIGYATCTSPGGSFGVGSSPSVTTGGDLTGTWTPGQLNSQRTLTLSNATGTAVTTASTVTFTVSSVTNPTPSVSTDQTFYARIYTYSDSTLPAAYTVSAPGAYSDSGGIALSTANQVSVAGTVQETLTFCVSGISVSASDCTAATVPTLELGHNSPKVLDSTVRDTVNAYSQLTTNAGGGAAVRMKNSNSCGGLSKDGGSTCQITAASATPNTIAAGNALFGVLVSSETMSVPSIYGTASNYGMDTTTSGNNVTSSYGSLVASSTGVLDKEDTTYTFAASASNTTPAGVYTAIMTLIATGTY
jgi:hypothetical protein